MLNTQSIEAVTSAQFGKHNWVWPLYDSYNFARIPQTVCSMFLGELVPGSLPIDTLAGEPPKANKVISIFIDALGWNQIAGRLQSDRFLQRAQTEGVVSKLTSQFPSTTPVHVTTIHTAMPLAQHGVVEGRYYEPKIDGLLYTFKFCEAGDRMTDTLRDRGIEASDIYPNSTIYGQLWQRQQVPSWSFAGSSDLYGAYSKAMREGATPVAYPELDLRSGLKKLQAHLGQNNNRGYYFLYFAYLDSLSHQQGPNAEQTQDLIDRVLSNLEEFVSTTNRSDTAIMVFADHGHMQADTHNIVSLHDSAPSILRLMPKSASGRPLTPGGNARDMFFYLRPERFEQGLDILRATLANHAEVEPTQKLLEEGYFGKNPSSALLGRLNGNYPSATILPYANRYVFWESRKNYGDGYGQRPLLKGHHGGLSRDEMEIPFIYLPPTGA